MELLDRRTSVINGVEVLFELSRMDVVLSAISGAMFVNGVKFSNSSAVSSIVLGIDGGTATPSAVLMPYDNRNVIQASVPGMRGGNCKSSINVVRLMIRTSVLFLPENLPLGDPAARAKNLMLKISVRNWTEIAVPSTGYGYVDAQVYHVESPYGTLLTMGPVIEYVAQSFSGKKAYLVPGINRVRQYALAYAFVSLDYNPSIDMEYV